MESSCPNFGPVRYTLGPVKVFAASAGKPYDVLYAEVESPDLHRLNHLLGELPHTDTYATYKPHATIAYVKPGMGQHYAAKFGRLNLSGVAKTLTFSTADRQTTTIPLGADLATHAAAVSDTLSDVMRGLGVPDSSHHHNRGSAQDFLTTHRKAFDKHHHFHDSKGRFSSAGSAGAVAPVGHPSHIRAAGKHVVRVARKFAASAKHIAAALALRAEGLGIVPEDILDTAHDLSRITYHTGNWLTQHTGVSAHSAAIVGGHVLAYAINKVKRALQPKGDAKHTKAMSASIGSMGGSLVGPPSFGSSITLRRPGVSKRKRRAARRFARGILKAMQGDGPAISPNHDVGDHGAQELLLASINAHAKGDRRTAKALGSLRKHPGKLEAILARLTHGTIEKGFKTNRPDGERWQGKNGYWWVSKNGQAVRAGAQAGAAAGGSSASSKPESDDKAEKPAVEKPVKQTVAQKRDQARADKAKMLQDAADAANVALTAPHTLTMEHVDALLGHLDKLTVPKLKKLARDVSLKVGGVKAALAGRLEEYVRSKVAAAAAEKKKKESEATGKAPDAKKQPHEMTKEEFDSVSAVQQSRERPIVDPIIGKREDGWRPSRDYKDYKEVHAIGSYLDTHKQTAENRAKQWEHLGAKVHAERFHPKPGKTLDVETADGRKELGEIQDMAFKSGKDYQQSLTNELKSRGYRYVKNGGYLGEKGELVSLFPSEDLQTHRSAVASALAAGKPVPPEVLADYPDLAAKYAKPPASGGKAPEGAKAKDPRAKKPAKPVAKPPEVQPEPAKPASEFGQIGKDHPINGKTRDEQIKQLAAISSRGYYGEEDPMGHMSGPPEGLDMHNFTADIQAAVDASPNAKFGVGQEMPDIYKTVGKKYGLSKHDFNRAIAHVVADGNYVSSLTWRSLLDDIPDPQLGAMIGSGKIVYRLNPLPGAERLIPTSDTPATPPAPREGDRNAESGSKPVVSTPKVETAESPAKSTDHNAVMSDLVSYVDKKTKDTTVGPDFDELYKHLKDQHPGLTVGGFHDALRSLDDTGHIRLKDWPRMLDDMPNPSLSLLSRNTHMYHVQAGRNTGEIDRHEVSPHSTEMPKAVENEIASYVNSGGGKSDFHDIYDHLKSKHPGVTYGVFQNAIRNAESSGKIKLSKWEKMADDIPHPELGFLDKKHTMMYHAHPGQSMTKSPASGEPAVKSSPAQKKMPTWSASKPAPTAQPPATPAPRQAQSSTPQLIPTPAAAGNFKDLATHIDSLSADQLNELKKMLAAKDAAKKPKQPPAPPKPLSDEDKAVVAPVVSDIKSLLRRFRDHTMNYDIDRSVPKDVVDSELAKLEKLTPPQLLHAARELNAAATLTEKTPRSKVLKQVSEMVRRVWKTSDNVHH